MEKNREIAIKIIDTFEELLNKYAIKLPNEERQGNTEESCIYGSYYFELEDTIVEILNKNI